MAISIVALGQGSLFSRKKELLVLREAISTRHPRVMVIKGAPGTGKTALGRALKDDPDLKCYFLQGKFEKLERAEPYRPFVDSLRRFIIEITDTQRERLKSMFMESNITVSDIQPLINAMPEIQEILGTNGLNELSNKLLPQLENFSWCQFSDAFLAFMNFLSNLAGIMPLVFFLDDVHWADQADIELIHSLAFADSAPRMTLLLTYRNEGGIGNDLFPHNDRNRHQTFEIELQEMSKTQVNSMISRIFQVEITKSMPLATLLWDQTKGNLFFITRYIELFVDKKLIRLVDGFWDWDISEIMLEHTDVDSLVSSEIMELSVEILEDLKIASCLGNSFDDEVFKHVASKTSKCVKASIPSSLLLFDSFSQKWSFAHDRIQEIMYLLIPDDRRESYHYTIGKTLWRRLDVDKLESFIFVVVGQLLSSKSLLVNKDERIAVAKLCLVAGEKAASVSSFGKAHFYFSSGIKLLDKRSWRTDYELCLRLHSCAVECSYGRGLADDISDHVNEVLQNSRCLEDSIIARLMSMQALGNIGKMKDAMDAGISFLALLGESFPSRFISLHVIVERKKAEKYLKRMTDEQIITGLPIMTDTIKLAAMQALNLTFFYAFTSNLSLAALIGLRIILLSLEHGISGLSCLGFSSYANYLCAFGLVHDGYRYGQISLKLHNRFKNRNFLARVYSSYYEGVHCWTNPIKECIEPLLYAYRIGVQTLDLECAMVCGATAYACKFEYAPLSESDKGFQIMSDKMEALSQDSILLVAKTLWQCGLNLMGYARDSPTVLNGKVYEEHRGDDIRSMSLILYSYSCCPRLLLRYLFGDFSNSSMEIAKSTRLSTKLHFSQLSPIFITLTLFIDGLLCIARARKMKRLTSPHAMRCSNRLRTWADNEPYSYLGKHLILKAELGSLRNNFKKTLRRHVECLPSFYVCAFVLLTCFLTAS